MGKTVKSLVTAMSGDASVAVEYDMSDTSLQTSLVPRLFTIYIVIVWVPRMDYRVLRHYLWYVTLGYYSLPITILKKDIMNELGEQIEIDV